MMMEREEVLDGTTGNGANAGVESEPSTNDWHDANDGWLMEERIRFQIAKSWGKQWWHDTKSADGRWGGRSHDWGQSCWDADKWHDQSWNYQAGWKDSATRNRRQSAPSVDSGHTNESAIGDLEVSDWSESDDSDAEMLRRKQGIKNVDTPTFNGTVPREFMRRIRLWRRLTPIPCDKQAAALYYKFDGEAWKDGANIDKSCIHKTKGVRALARWVRTNYCDSKMSEVGRVMTSSFRIFKRGNSEDLMTYKRSFARGLEELTEQGVELPEKVKAWFFFDKLAIHELLIL